MAGLGTSELLLCLSPDDFALLASSVLDFQHALGQFAAECEVTGMKIRTSSLLEKVTAPGGRVKSILGVLFMDDGKLQTEMDNLQ